MHGHLNHKHTQTSFGTLNLKKKMDKKYNDALSYLIIEK